jgi:hypothetical protein
MRTSLVSLALLVAAVCAPARFAAAAEPQFDQAAMHAFLMQEMSSALSGERTDGAAVAGMKLQRDTLGPLLAAVRPGLQGIRPNQGKGLALRRSFTEHTALALGAGMAAAYGGTDMRLSLALQYGF